MARLTRRGEDRVGLYNSVENAYVQTLKKVDDEFIGCFDEASEKLAALEDAEEQGLLLILPCAIGDTLYFIDRYRGEIYKEAIVDGIGIHWTNNKDIGDFIPLSIIGENVFLSIEEAKAALAAEKGESR